MRAIGGSGFVGYGLLLIQTRACRIPGTIVLVLDFLLCRIVTDAG